MNFQGLRAGDPPPPGNPLTKTSSEQQQQTPAPSASSATAFADTALAAVLGLHAGSTWHGSDESLKYALAYRAEEERRRAEEERTKQELHRLELRRHDIELLREGIRYGIPPSVMPFIFIGNGVTGATAEWIRDYVARIWQQQHQQSEMGVQAPTHVQPQTDPRFQQQQQQPQQASQHHHRRSQSQQQLLGLSGASLPTLPALITAYPPKQQHAPVFSPQEQSPVSQQLGIYRPPQSVTPPLQVHQIEFAMSKANATPVHYRSSPPVSAMRSPSPSVAGPQQQQQPQPTIQFHHWQPNATGKERASTTPGGIVTATATTTTQAATSATATGATALPPLPGNGIPRSPTRSILNPMEDVTSPKRRRQSAVFDMNTGKPIAQLGPALSTGGGGSTSPGGSNAAATALPPISSLSPSLVPTGALGPGLVPRKRGSGHSRHRSDASLHGFEPYTRSSPAHIHSQILNPVPISQQQQQQQPRRVDSMWESSGGGVGALVAAAQSELREMNVREQSATEQPRRE
ncbi:uncharacterized protein V1518DRAFT_385483 [Limtongia smithiae]|uniref:uncharacterized protein n=1 Tax=Limtongia smithiae TaxID=1125753 RepID=UPI0034CDAEC4